MTSRKAISTGSGRPGRYRTAAVPASSGALETAKFARSIGMCAALKNRWICVKEPSHSGVHRDAFDNRWRD